MDTRLMVRSMTVEAAGVLSLELVHPGGDKLDEWEPGAHVDVVLGTAGGDVVRQYSLCGDPADRLSYRVGVLREAAGRGGSVHVHDVLRPGDLVRVRGPKNHFRLVDADEYVFVAGGIGVTPLIPMAAEVRRRGVPYRFLYGGRSAASMAFVDRLREHGDLLTVWPQDTYGLLDLPGAVGDPRPGLAVYCCGPEPLLAAMEALMADWPAGALHVERFAAPPPTADAPPLESGAFEVVLQRSGRCLVVPADRSLLDVLVDAGAPVLSDCREGICASCETPVLSGEIDHRDHVLTPQERTAGRVMMACVSRAAGRLVVDF
ncbi:MAG: PDR/VanB family oxidoreductase [Kineosporiaceae bacterium]